MATLSVVLPTYRGDDRTSLQEAIESITSQTRTPDEFVIVRDGPLPEANAAVLDKYMSTHDYIRLVRFEKNRGRALARRIGVQRSTGELVAMMDADDVSVPSRLEKQETFLQNHPNVDVVGGQLLEIDPETGTQIGVRSLPKDHESLRKLAKTRSPVTQSTVMFRRETVLSAGNYRDVDRMEDYDLWVRMLTNGARFRNLPDILTKARTGDDMYNRRAGKEYAREEVRLQLNFVDQGFISIPRAFLNLLMRVPIRFVPSKIRKLIYESLFRTPVSETDTRPGGLGIDDPAHTDKSSVSRDEE